MLYVFNKLEKPLEKPTDTKKIKLTGKIRGKYKTKKQIKYMILEAERRIHTESSSYV